MAKVKVDITRLLSEYEESRNKRRALMSSTAISPNSGEVKEMIINKDDQRTLTFLREIRDSNGRIVEQNDRIIDLLELLVDQKAPKKQIAATPDVDDEENYNTAAIRKMFGISVGMNNDELKRAIPGRWQKVGNHEFMKGSDLKEAMQSPSFFRNR